MKNIENARVQIYASTHPGMTGKQNEDRYGASLYQISETDLRQVVVGVLCDGIGGHRAGEVAAEIAVETIIGQIASSSGLDPLNTLYESIQTASQRIYEESQKNQSRHGMGSTCACALILESQLYTASVGDSRIYLLRDNDLIQLSTDHTWVQEAIEARLITETEAVSHPNMHVIRRYLGSPTPPEPDLRLNLNAEDSEEDAYQNQGLNLLPGDVVFLCSDGLTDLVEDQEIKALLLRTHNLQIALNKLIALANKRGGHDNITLVALQPIAKAISGKKKSNRTWLIGCSISLLVIMLLSALVFLSIYFSNKQSNAQHPPTSPATDILPSPTSLPGLTSDISQTEACISPTPEAPTQVITPQPSITPWPTNTLPVNYP